MTDNTKIENHSKVFESELLNKTEIIPAISLNVMTAFCFSFFCFADIYSIIYWNLNQLIGLVDRVFANGSGDLGSISSRVIPKTLKMVLDTFLLNAQHYKVRIKGNVEKSWERSSALPYISV